MTISMKLTAVTVASALALTGCVSNTADPNANRTRDGAILGGMLGGFLGAASDDDNRGRNAVFGAAAGAIAGGAIGAALDRQAQDLRASMANDDILIRNTGEELVVTLPDGILFDFDSAAIRASLQSDLRALARNLRAYPRNYCRRGRPYRCRRFARIQHGPVLAPRRRRGRRPAGGRRIARSRAQLRPRRGTARGDQPDARGAGAEPPGRGHHPSHHLIRDPDFLRASLDLRGGAVILPYQSREGGGDAVSTHRGRETVAFRRAADRAADPARHPQARRAATLGTRA